MALQADIGAPIGTRTAYIGHAQLVEESSRPNRITASAQRMRSLLGAAFLSGDCNIQCQAHFICEIHHIGLEHAGVMIARNVHDLNVCTCDASPAIIV